MEERSSRPSNISTPKIYCIESNIEDIQPQIVQLLSRLIQIHQIRRFWIRMPTLPHRRTQTINLRNTQLHRTRSSQWIWILLLLRCLGSRSHPLPTQVQGMSLRSQVRQTNPRTSQNMPILLPKRIENQFITKRSHLKDIRHQLRLKTDPGPNPCPSFLFRWFSFTAHSS